MITVGALLEFILKHREDKVFKGFTKEEVAGAIAEGIEDGMLFYASDGEKITGMILAEKIHTPKIVFVVENLAMSLRTLKQFAMMAQERFPGWKLEAMRHNKHRKFNTEKLYRKLKI